MVASPAGLEPATPGFIPLRLPPPHPRGRVRGLDYPFTVDLVAEVLRCRPSSLYTVPVPVGASGLARDWLCPREADVERSPNLSGSAARFPLATPNCDLGNLCSVQLSYGDSPGAFLTPSHGAANRAGAFRAPPQTPAWRSICVAIDLCGDLAATRPEPLRDTETSLSRPDRGGQWRRIRNGSRGPGS